MSEKKKSQLRKVGIVGALILIAYMIWSWIFIPSLQDRIIFTGWTFFLLFVWKIAYEVCKRDLQGEKG